MAQVIIVSVPDQSIGFLVFLDLTLGQYLGPGWIGDWDLDLTITSISMSIMSIS